MEDVEQAPTSSGFTAVVELFFGSPYAPLDLAAARFPLDPEAVCAAAGVSRLAELGRSEVFAVKPEVLLDRDRRAHLLRLSVENRCLLWIVEEDDPAALGLIESALPGMLHRIDATETPRVWGLGVHAMVTHSLSSDEVMRRKLASMDVSSLPRRLRNQFQQWGVPSWKAGWFVRRWRDPRTWVYLAVFAYSSLRALPAVYVPQFHGSVWILWAIDIITAAPYTWGVLAMITEARPAVRAVGTATALVTFIAPYVYFWIHGSGYPPLVVAVVALMILGSVAVEVLRYWQDRRLGAAYRAGSDRSLSATR
ncbi:hypothetical protein I6B53_05540 [Schaalia sp. 19OD2882]|uniref:hypothetical protein n=1 Tax=Schaalia sp. 19OD2882 TaxID=2794089 RepID=UPI001C1EE9E3|nr:hypothetical protein [Schaalia sp. 19OD2882]QWW20523.1 hypothetical protein I6B53_05540 [Schaalia sp. 19OD2882]